MLEGSLRASPGRCSEVGGGRSLEPVVLAASPLPNELNPDNNRRELRLDLACVPAGTPPGLGPMPDPVVVAVEPYQIELQGQRYLQLAAHVHNHGTPIRADALVLRAALLGEGLPADLSTPVEGESPLARAIVDEPLNASVPRRTVVCGLGGTSWPLGALNRLGSPPTAEVRVGTRPAVRQITESNDRLRQALPAATTLPAAEQTACGPRPAQVGVAPASVRWPQGSPWPGAGTPSLQARAEAQRRADGNTLVRAELSSLAPGRVEGVEYQWLRDGVWAGGGRVDVPADAPVTLTAVDNAGTNALWELVVDPSGLLGGASVRASLRAP